MERSDRTCRRDPLRSRYRRAGRRGRCAGRWRRARLVENGNGGRGEAPAIFRKTSREQGRTERPNGPKVHSGRKIMTLDIPWISWGLGFLPLGLLLLRLLGANWGAAEAGPLSWLVALVIAFFYFEAPLDVIGFESAKGIWSALTVLYVVWASIFLCEVSHEGQAFDPLRRGITQL